MVHDDVIELIAAEFPAFPVEMVVTALDPRRTGAEIPPGLHDRQLFVYVLAIR